MTRCLHCGTTDEARFPLARPRKDGTRGHFAYCDECLALPERRGGGRTARNTRATRAYRERVAA